MEKMETVAISGTDLKSFLNCAKADVCIQYGKGEGGDDSAGKFSVHSALIQLMSPGLGKLIRESSSSSRSSSSIEKKEQQGEQASSSSAETGPEKTEQQSVEKQEVRINLDQVLQYRVTGAGNEDVLSVEQLFERLIENIHGVKVKFEKKGNALINLLNYYLICTVFDAERIVTQVQIELKKLLEQVPEDDYLDIVAFAVKNEEEQLLWLLNTMRGVPDIMQVPEWAHVQKSFLLTFIKSNKLHVADEMTVLNCVNNWIQQQHLQQQLQPEDSMGDLRVP